MVRAAALQAFVVTGEEPLIKVGELGVRRQARFFEQSSHIAQRVYCAERSSRVSIAISSFQAGIEPLFKNVAWAELRRISKLQSTGLLDLGAGLSAQGDVSISDVVALFVAMPIAVRKRRVRQHDRQAGLL